MLSRYLDELVRVRALLSSGISKRGGGRCEGERVEVGRVNCGVGCSGCEETGRVEGDDGAGSAAVVAREKGGSVGGDGGVRTRCSSRRSGRGREGEREGSAGGMREEGERGQLVDPAASGERYPVGPSSVCHYF